MPRVILERAAIADLEDIAAFIARDNPRRAYSFIDEIQSSCALWAENPLAGRDRSGLADGVRSFPHGNYVIFYRPLHDGLAILRILHGRRDIGAVSP